MKENFFLHTQTFLNSSVSYEIRVLASKAHLGAMFIKILTASICLLDVRSQFST